MGGRMDIWGWIEPVAKIFGNRATSWARRRKLRAALENPQWAGPEGGRTLDALTRVAGEADTETGRENTRVLLRGVRRGNKTARRVKTRDPQAPETWGMRSED